jgi:hypothetical protein
MLRCSNAEGKSKGIAPVVIEALFKTGRSIGSQRESDKSRFSLRQRRR